MIKIKIAIDLQTWSFELVPLGITVEIPNYEERQHFLSGDKLLFVTYNKQTIVLPVELFEILEREIYQDEVVSKAMKSFSYD